VIAGHLLTARNCPGHLVLSVPDAGRI